MNIEHISALAQEVNSASDDGDIDALRRLAGECAEGAEACDGPRRVILRYFESNAFGGIADQTGRDAAQSWSWEHPDLIAQILALRKAARDPSYPETPRDIQCQIRTNLGNTLSRIGRPIAAIEQWNAALDLNSKFAMAWGSRGTGLEAYASQLFDHGHAGIILHEAARSLATAISKNAYWEMDHPIAHSSFRRKKAAIDAALERIEFDKSVDLDRWSLGRSHEEKRYRRWCLHNALFLTPLNDALTLSVAARDVLHLPDHSYTLEEEPRYPRYYNILKQEFVSARFRLFRALECEDPKYAFKDVLLLDEGEDNLYGFYLEDLKSAFRIAYGIFDKVALFLNEYFGVGLPPNGVSLRSVWASKHKGQSALTLRPPFQDKCNWMLRGLYFLSKDLLDPDFKDNAEPDAERLYELRQQAEHRFLGFSEMRDVVTDDGAHEILPLYRFEDRALRILKLAREAIMYLSLAMHAEEIERKAKEKRGPLLTMSIASREVTDFDRGW